MGIELLQGRPEAMDGRLDKERRCYDLLDGLGIGYQRIDHAPAMTIRDCEEIDQVLQVPICKNLLLCNRQHTAFYLLVMPGQKQLHTGDLSRQIGSSRLSFAAPEYMERFLDITPGSLSILGLMNDRDNHVRLLMDPEVLDSPYFCCHPCINTSSLRFTTEDLKEKLIPALGHAPLMVNMA